MIKSVGLLAAGSIALSGCVSTSFAPPEVNIYRQMNSASLTAECRLSGTDTGDIKHNVDGALWLIHNFVNSYRCSMRAAADGRQPFEIGSFLSLAGSTAAVALGASPDVAIIGSGANSIFTAASKYYSPQEQTEILSSAVDALLCVQTEAVGIAAFESTVAREGEEAAEDGGPSVEVSVERQYFNMVTASLLSVERVAAQRLSRRGSFDGAGVVAELEILQQRLAEAKQKRLAAGDAESSDGTGEEEGEEAAEFMDTEARSILHLEELRPQLQLCVTRAKI